MAFNPDEYLAKKPSSFNPDEYLKSKPPVEPTLSPEEQMMGAASAPSEGGIASIAKRPAAGGSNSMTADEYRAQLAAREAKGYDRTISGTALDAGITLLKGAIGLPEAFVGLADIPTLGYAGKVLEDAGYKPKEAKAILDTYLSEAQQYANRQVKEAKGFGGTLGAAVQNPSVIATSVVESLAPMLGGAGIAQNLLKVAPSLAPYLAGAIGEGLIGAGSSAEQMRQGTEDKLLTGKQAVSAVGSGVGTAAFGVAGGKLAAKLGLDDIDTLLVGAGGQGGSKSIKDFAKRATASGITEGVFEEMPQSAQETMWMNYATDKPLLDGVPEAAAMGLVTGAAMGAGATAVRGRRKEAEQGLPSVVPEAPVAEEQDIAKRIDDVLEKYGQPTTQPPASPEAGIAGLAPQPPAPPAPPAAPVAEEDQPAQDLDAMLREALGATEADINTVNMPKAPVAEAVEAPPVEVPSVEAPPVEQPPSTELIQQVLPKVALSDKFGTLPVGEYSAEGTFEQDGRKWQVESLSRHGDGLVAQTIDQGEPVRKAFRFEQPVNPKLQELVDLNNQLAKLGKAKETTYEKLNELLQERASLGPRTVDQLVDQSTIHVKDLLSKQKPAVKPTSATQDIPYVLAGEGVITQTAKPRPVPKDAVMFSNDSENVFDDLKRFADKHGIGPNVLATGVPGGFVLGGMNGIKGFVTESNIDKFKAAPAAPVAPEAIDVAEIQKQRGRLLLKEMREGSTPESAAEIERLTELLGEKSAMDEAREALKNKKPEAETPTPAQIDKDLDKKIASKLKEVQAEREGSPIRIAKERELEYLQKKKAKQEGVAPAAEAPAAEEPKLTADEIYETLRNDEKRKFPVDEKLIKSMDLETAKEVADKYRKFRVRTAGNQGGPTPVSEALKKHVDSLPKESYEQTMTKVRANQARQKLEKGEELNDKEKQEIAKQDLEDALGDLSMILTKGTRLNMMPEQEQKLLPVLTKLMDAAFRLGYYEFKRAARFVLDTVKDRLGKEASDQITLDHLQGAYIGMAGKYKDEGASPKKEVISVESLDELEAEPVAGEPAEESVFLMGANLRVSEDIKDHLIGGGSFKTIVEARKFIEEITGNKIEPGTSDAKKADEQIEAGVVMAARQIVEDGRADGLSSSAIYEQLVGLYERQPNLSVRSSTSVANQAYSTPAPLAFVASELAGINDETTVYEPTAGNGMLTIGANPDLLTVNELDANRYEVLRKLLATKGATVTQENALEQDLDPNSFDVVIENPPFGKVGNISNIDQDIAMKSLETMKEDGKAVLILGGVQANTEEGRREGYRGKAKREFYYNLYNKYNVVDHFTAGGNMYAKQGTTYPVDIIVIDGVGKSKRDLPAADLPELITSYEQLKEKLNDRMVSGGDRGARGADSGVSTKGRAEPEPVDRGAVGEGERAGVEGGRPSGERERGVSEPESARGGQREPSGGRAGEVQPRPTDESERATEGRPVSDKGKRGEAGGKAGAEGRKPSELGGVSVVSGERVESGLKERAKKEEETANQVSYTPHSQATAVGTLVPKAMAQAIEDSISRVEAQVGNVDEFVAEQLEMDPETLRDQFSAEQIDALVLAIRNAEEGKGFIIGDQTGVGKGRVVAAMIKYALNTGKIPIFVTEKPNLYSDMIRDLDDIGMTDKLGLDTAKPKIFMTNSSESVPYTLIRTVKGEVTENNLTLKPAKSSGLDAIMKQMIEKNSLGDYKVIFTTYSQLQSVKGKPTERQNFIKHFGAGNYMIFDESHNAGGAGVEPAKAEKEAGVNIGQGRSGFVRNLVKEADGTFFSSATYAKRPDVMDLYSSTDMKLAVDNITQLSDAIKAGGIPMQQTVANMLTQVGQYIRRERTFAGVAYNTQETKVDKDTAENMATSMRDILAFSREKEAVVKSLQKSLDKQGARAGLEGEKTTVQSANFGSIMHNLIDQMLLSLKSQDSVRHAIERLKAGEKVVMTVSNTMGSFLQNYADDMKIGVGDPVNLSFADLYIRYLEKQRMVTIKKPGGQKEEYRLTDEDLGESLASRYYEILDFIRNAGFGSAPISPIDYMHSELRKAGYKTEEITGRTVTLNYESGKPLLATRSANIKQRVNAVKAFNSGTADVIILNQAGSTGLSLHASSKVKDQRKRHMIIVQPEKNIDTHMQMLGRVHRTGQVMPPSYSQMMADIPAEMRPAAVLLKKMASLSANTTASRKSAVSAEGAVDFMNDYGGQIAQEYLRDNPEVYQDLGGEKITQLKDNAEDADETDIRRLTGYIPILPIKQQEEVYKDLIERYNDLIEREDSMGSNKLEAKAMDLDAQTVSSKPITEDKGDPSLFAQPAYMERVDIKRTVKPYSKDEVAEMVRDNREKNKDDPKYKVADINAKAQEYAKEQLADAEARGADPVRIAAMEGQFRSQRDNIRVILQSYPIGSNVSIKNTNGVFVYGVVTDIESKGKTKNPVAGSDWKMTLALANGDAKSLNLTFSQIGTRYQLAIQNEVQYLNPETLQNERILLPELFDRGATVRREKRWMVTGNILSGFAAVNNMGQILSYTKNDGTTGQGVLMPRTFDFEKEQKNAPIRLKTVADAMRFFDQFGRGSMATTPDAVLRIRSEGNGNFKFVTSSSKREGGTFFLDKTLTGIIGDFYKSGSIMSAIVFDESKTKKAIEYILKDRQDSLVAATNKEEAREMFAPKDIPLANIQFNNERMSMNPAMNAAMDREALIREYQKVRQKSAAISAKFAKGEAGLDEQKALTFLKEAATDLKDNIKETKPEGRLPKNFFAKATEDWNKDLISDDVYDVIRTLYEQYPEVLEGMKFSVKKQPEASDAAGQFFPLPRIVRLYKGTSGVENPETIRHEIVHSLEQMMDSPAARALVDDWSDKLGKAIKTEKSAAGQRYFRAVLDFHNSPSQETYQAALDALPSMQYYQYMNPSEYWAVNAEKLMARKLGTGWDKFVLAVKRLFEGLKFMFGFNNQYIVQRTFNDIMNAREVRFTNRALNDYVTQEAIPLANMVKNYKGGAGALAAWDSAEDTELARLQYRIVDKQVDTRMVVKAITEQIGDIRDQFDPSLQETLYHGAKASKIEKFLDGDLRPLIKKMAATGVDYRDFEHYLHMRHAKIRNEIVAKRNPAMPDGGSGIFNDEVDDYFASLTSAEEAKYKDLAETVDKWVEETQDLLIQYGLEKPETIARWRESLPFYVPLKRDPDELDYVSPGSGLGQGFGTRGSFSKSATGSYKTVVDVLANIALQRESAIIRGEKAKVGRALYALAIQNPNPNFWKPVNPDAIRNKKKLKEEMAGFNLTVAEADALFAEPPSPRIDPATGLVEYRVNTALRNSSNVFPVRINGEDRFIFFNPGEPRAKRMAEALKNMDATQLEGYLGTMAEATRFIAAMNTQYNPVFGAWNFVRDVFAGTINLASTEIKNRKWQVMRDATPALRAIFTDLRGMKESVAGLVKDPEQKKWIALWEQFQEIGGQTGYSEQFSRSKDKASIVQREMAKMDRGNVRKKVDAMMDWLSDYNDAMENAVRLSAFKAAMDEGMTPQRAAALAKNLTVNFNRKGQATANANALYAFFNARVQGTTRMMEVLVQNKDGKFSLTSIGKKIIAGGMLLGSMQALVLMAAGFDGDEPPDFLKDKNFILPTFGLTGEKKYLIVPMPLGWNLFPNIGRELTEYALINSGNMKGRRGITDTISNIAAQVADMFNPLGAGGIGNMVMPTIIDPVFNAFVTNKDAFGRPISRQSRETTPTPGWERSRDNATALSKALAYGLNYITGGGKDGIGKISPTADQLDYIAKEYAGGVGREITKVVRYIGNKIEGEETPSYSVPIAGKLYGGLDQPSAVADKFYKNVKAMAEHEGAIKRIKERKGDVNDYRKENKEATVRLINRANYVENEVAKINREIRALAKKEAPEKDIKAKKEKRDALMKAYNEEVRRVQ